MTCLTASFIKQCITPWHEFRPVLYSTHPATTANNLVRCFLAGPRPSCIDPSLRMKGICARKMAIILAVVGPGLFEDGRGGLIDSCRCCTVGGYKGNFDCGLSIVDISRLFSVVYKYKTRLVYLPLRFVASFIRDIGSEWMSLARVPSDTTPLHIN